MALQLPTDCRVTDEHSKYALRRAAAHLGLSLIHIFLRWSVVVVAALLFFGIYVAVLDNGIITPLLFLISGLGA